MADETPLKDSPVRDRLRAERLLADRTTFAVDSVDHAAIVTAIERDPAARPQLVGLFRRARPD